MKKIFSLLLFVLLLDPQLLRAADTRAVALTVTDAYMDMRTGPGAAYPVFNVIQRGEKLYILNRKTRWYKVITDNEKTGWVSRQQMMKTLLPNGDTFKIAEKNRAAFLQRNWEIGAMSGELERAPLLSLYGGYSLTSNISLEMTLTHSVGNVSSSDLYKLNLLMQPFPEWSYSPYFTMGAGAISVKPNATLIEPADKNNPLSQIGLGIKTYLSRRFILRMEFNQYIIFSANNDNDHNEDITEWKIGFAIFF